MSVTTDLAVLQGWPKPHKKGQALTAGEVAAALGITVFQITARLKGMEGRGFLVRDAGGKWSVTPQGLSERENPSPSMTGANKTMRSKDSAGNHSGPPDDANVPRLRLMGADWAPSDEQFRAAQIHLPEVQKQLAVYQADSLKFRREIMALNAEYDHCKRVVQHPRKGKWTSRVVRPEKGEPQTLYIAPDMREYVFASPYETADLLIEAKIAGFSPSRLRLFSTSSAAKAVKKANNLNAELEDRKAAKAQEARNARIIQEEITLGKEEEARREQERRTHESRQRKAKGGKKLHTGRNRGRASAPKRRT